MKKFFFVILCMICFVNAGIATYTQSFDMVKVIEPAKSKQIMCKTRVDLTYGLVDNYACGVNDIQVRTSSDFWVGSLGPVAAYSDKRYAEYDTARYVGMGNKIVVDYMNRTRDADEDNKIYVTCPAGTVHKIVDDAYTCVKPYICDNDEYAIDEINCSVLPENAHRNKKIGYTCNNGYVKQGDICEEIVQCDETDKYNKNENCCYQRPEHSHWFKDEFVWECDEGYVEQGDICEEIVQCDGLGRYYEPSNTCIYRPIHSHWNAENSVNWSCDNGYIISNNTCIRKSICLTTQKYDEFTNTCIDPPEHAYWSNDDRSNDDWSNDDWSNDDRSNDEYYCEDGYVKVSYGCEVKKTCAHYDEENNECFTKPEHSHWVYSDGATWACDEKYHEDGNGNCFTCEEPFQFNYETGTCVTESDNENYENKTEIKKHYFMTDLVYVGITKSSNKAHLVMKNNTEYNMSVAINYIIKCMVNGKSETNTTKTVYFYFNAYEQEESSNSIDGVWRGGMDSIECTGTILSIIPASGDKSNFQAWSGNYSISTK